MKEGKSFEISQHQVLEAYKRVKANRGAGGTDGINFTIFEKDFKEQPIQTLEQNVIRKLLSYHSKRCRDTQERWKEEITRYSNNNRQSGTNGSEDEH